MNKSTFHNRLLSVHGRQVFIQEKLLDKPVVIVFIHGCCLSVRSWERQFNSELLNPFGLISFDLAGHGSSDHTSDLDAYSVAGSVQLLLDLIDEFQLTNFILAGHSLGGHIALQPLPMPDCRGVFCMTMPLTKPVDFGQMYSNGELLMRTYQANPEPEALSAYVRTLFRPHAPELPPSVTDNFLHTDPAIHTGIMQGLLAGNYQDKTDTIRNGRVPVDIIQGALKQVHDLDYLTGLDLSLWHHQPLLVP